MPVEELTTGSGWHTANTSGVQELYHQVERGGHFTQPTGEYHPKPGPGSPQLPPRSALRVHTSQLAAPSQNTPVSADPELCDTQGARGRRPRDEGGAL